MKLKNTIRKVLKEGVKEKMMDFIDNFGIETACRYVGGYDELKRIVGDNAISREQKLDFIRDYMDRTDGGISLFEMGGAIFYKEDNSGNIHQIEYLGMTRVIVNIWGGYKNETDFGEYGVYYDELESDSLDDVFEVIIDNLT